jgi:hypothetical protein
VQAYIAACRAGKATSGAASTLIVRTVPGVRKVVKWNSPFYGVEGQGWFLSFHVLTRYVEVTFFRGASLTSSSTSMRTTSSTKLSSPLG